MTRRPVSFKQQMIVDEPTINLTPLIDVVFVILIMFIVIAPLLDLDQIELAEGSHIPAKTPQAVQESSPIAIHVYQDNTIWFNDHPVIGTQLAEKLKQAKIYFPQAHPQIFHDKRAHFGTYQFIKNAAEEAGFSQMEIILKPA